MNEYKIFKSPWKALKLIFGCSIFIGLGIFLLYQSDTPRWVSWLNIGFFGLGYPIGIFQIIDRRPQIIINEIGIFDRTTHKNFINWEIIQDIYLSVVNGQKFICLAVDQEFEPSRRKGKISKGMAGLSKALGFQELNISLGSVTVNSERLLEFLQTMKKADKPNRASVLKKAVSI